MLKENERVINEGLEYLSEKEWRVVDGKLRRLAQHTTARLRKAVPGDTISMLAVRARAFCVGTLMFTRYEDCDALVENAAGETLKDVLREYNVAATEDLLELNRSIEASIKGILLPSTAEAYLTQADRLMNEQLNLQKMLKVVIDNLRRRVAVMEKQKWELKKATLRKQVEYSHCTSICIISLRADRMAWFACL